MQRTAAGRSIQVIDITKNKDLTRMEKSPYIWAIALYQPNCG